MFVKTKSITRTWQPFRRKFSESDLPARNAHQRNPETFLYAANRVRKKCHVFPAEFCDCSYSLGFYERNYQCFWEPRNK
ncbi:hypothetical protein C0J52_09881 [Blattella germanica]|nr:hypothetical protein C0J52_09881 [Blattella germanica]